MGFSDDDNFIVDRRRAESLPPSAADFKGIIHTPKSATRLEPATAVNLSCHGPKQNVSNNSASLSCLSPVDFGDNVPNTKCLK